MTDFYDLAHAAEQEPTAADFVALREAYRTSEAYRPIKHIPQSKLLQITNSADSYVDVISTCENILKANPMDLEARMMLAHAQEHLGESAEKTHQFAEGLLDAILASGDGKSLETAWVLLSNHEAWTVMRVFGMKATDQQRVYHDDGRIYDVYQGKIDGQSVQMYFDVTAPTEFIEEAIGGE